MNEGVSLRANTTCMGLLYGHLPSDFSGMFVDGSDLDQAGENCFLSSEGLINFGLADCGTQQRNIQNQMSFHTFVKHKAELNGISMSIMDPIPIQCSIRSAMIITSFKKSYNIEHTSFKLPFENVYL